LVDIVLYEKLRRLLSSGGSALGLPKHDITTTLLSNMFLEEEARILVSSFEKSGQPVNIRKISELSGVPRDQLSKILEDMHYKGKILKLGPLYTVLPYLPGLFEVYFTHNRDDPERMKEAAKAHLKLFRMGHPFELSSSNYTIYRVLPTIGPTEKLIEMNASVDVKHQVLPYEVLKEYLSKAKPDLYAVVACSCRNAARLAGEPCKRTDENFCVTTGILAKSVLDSGVGRQVSLDELMDIMKQAEKSGLVHQTFNTQDTAIFMCNCCDCCCGFLKSVKEYNNFGSITKSNFEPSIDKNLCTLCETCMNICPMDAIYHHWPHQEDLSDDLMMIRKEQCIGCGVCASNCPSEAISLQKVREFVPLKSSEEMTQKINAGKIH
jgi:formate hydrogenlyase subunit 6/NADH:ubiquinone oxidoreductase subunit I